MSCGHCQKNSDLKACGSCGCVSYCSKECQTKAWPLHKGDCKETKLIASVQGLHLSSELSGIEVVDSGSDLGRVTVALRDFSIGDVIMAETAALVYRASDVGSTFAACLRSFKRARKKNKQAILSMFHPPMDSPEAITRLLSCPASTLASEHELDVDVVKALYLICEYNAHDFFGSDDVKSYDKQTANDPTQKPRFAALFDMGSKVQHSCFPNATYRSVSGRLVYFAVRNISAGDRVSYSYINFPLESPKAYRRDFLMASKSFSCQCSACIGPEYNRPLPCASCSEGLCVKGGSGEDGAWKCLLCKAKATDADLCDSIKIESEIARKLTSLDQRVTSIGLYPGVLKEAMSLKAECGKHLGRSHYLFALAFNVITKIAASEAHMLQTAGQQAELLCRRGMSIQKSRWESVASSLELIAWREATAHSYQQGALLESSYLNRRVVLPQEPQERVKLIFDQWSKSGLGMNWSSGKEAFYAGMDLADIREERQAAVIFHRYRRSILEGFLHTVDEDAKKIVDIMEKYPASHRP